MDRKIKSFSRPLSIFRVTKYEYRYYTRKRTHYPCFRLRTAESSFYLTLKEAEEWVSDNGRIHRFVKEIVNNESVFGTLALQQLVTMETEDLKQQKRDLKAALHRGDYDNQSYERRVNAISQRIKEAEQELTEYKNSETLKTSQGEALPFWYIEDQAKKLRNETVEKSNHQLTESLP